jgi:hypothetical protein
MEPEGSLPCSQEPATGLCPQSIDAVHNLKPNVFILLNIILSFTPRVVEMRKAYKILFRKPERKRLLERPRLGDGRIILK